MKTPVDKMLDGVKWDVTELEAPEDKSIPYATHHGVFNIAGLEIRCYQLNDGRRILDADDVHRVFGLTK